MKSFNIKVLYDGVIIDYFVEGEMDYFDLLDLVRRRINIEVEEINETKKGD